MYATCPGYSVFYMRGRADGREQGQGWSTRVEAEHAQAPAREHGLLARAAAVVRVDSGLGSAGRGLGNPA